MKQIPEGKRHITEVSAAAIVNVVGLGLFMEYKIMDKPKMKRYRYLRYFLMLTHVVAGVTLYWCAIRYVFPQIHWALVLVAMGGLGIMFTCGESLVQWTNARERELLEERVNKFLDEAADKAEENTK